MSAGSTICACSIRKRAGARFVVVERHAQPDVGGLPGLGADLRQLGQPQATALRLVGVGSEQPRPPAAERAVGVELEPDRAQPSLLERAALEQLLVQRRAERGVGRDPQRELPLPRQRAHRVPAGAVAGSARVHVVDSGQPHRDELRRGLGQRLLHHPRRRDRDHVLHQQHRVVDQDPGRPPAAVAVDPSAGRIGRGGADPGGGQRGAVDPERVAVDARHRRRAGGHGLLQPLGVGPGAPRPVILVPAAPQHPGVAGVRLGEGADALERLVQRARPEQVGAALPDRVRGDMAVRVDQAGHGERAGELPHRAADRDQLRHLGPVQHPLDAAAVDDQPVGPGALRVAGPEARPGEDVDLLHRRRRAAAPAAPAERARHRYPQDERQSPRRAPHRAPPHRHPPAPRPRDSIPGRLRRTARCSTVRPRCARSSSTSTGR